MRWTSGSSPQPEYAGEAEPAVGEARAQHAQRHPGPRHATEPAHHAAPVPPCPRGSPVDELVDRGDGYPFGGAPYPAPEQHLPTGGGAAEREQGDRHERQAHGRHAPGPQAVGQEAAEWLGHRACDREEAEGQADLPGGHGEARLQDRDQGDQDGVGQIPHQTRQQGTTQRQPPPSGTHQPASSSCGSNALLQLGALAEQPIR